MKRHLGVLIALVTVIIIFFIVCKTYMQYIPSISIINTRWQKVHIQVREGKNPSPMRNKLIFDQCLTKGQSRTFAIDDCNDIVYRRDSDPNHADSVHFTNWIYAKCNNSSTFILNNP